MLNRKKLIEIMESKNITAYKLWKLSGVSQSTISDIINKEDKNPTTKTLQKIADALEVSLDAFFDGDDASNESKSSSDIHNINPKFKPIIDSLDRAGDLQDEDIDEIRQQMEFLINLKRKKKSNS